MCVRFCPSVRVVVMLLGPWVEVVRAFVWLRMWWGLIWLSLIILRVFVSLRLLLPVAITRPTILCLVLCLSG